MNLGLEVAEEIGTDQQSDAQAAVVLVVVEQVLAIAVIEVQHQVLVIPLAEAESHIQNCVEIEVPSLAFH